MVETTTNSITKTKSVKPFCPLKKRQEALVGAVVKNDDLINLLMANSESIYTPKSI